MDAEQENVPKEALEHARLFGKSDHFGAIYNMRRRFSADYKMAAVLRVMRGEPMRAVADDLGINVVRLRFWHDRMLVTMASAMKVRKRDNRDEVIASLKIKIGEMTLANDSLKEKIAVLKGRRHS